MLINRGLFPFDYYKRFFLATPSSLHLNLLCLNLITTGDSVDFYEKTRQPEEQYTRREQAT